MSQQPSDQMLMQFDSHIDGRNAIVSVYRNRIEWSRKGIMGTGAKAALGVATGGVSLIATGVRGKHDTEMIPVRSITGVSTRKSGLTRTEVVVTSPSGAIGFRCSGDEAKRFQGLLLQLMG